MTVWTTDGQQLPVPHSIVRQCPALLDLCEHDTSNSVVIPLQYSAEVLQYVVGIRNDLPVDMGTLCLLTEAANFLGYESLLQKCVARHQDIMRQYSTDQIRQLYNVPAPQPEAVASIKQEHAALLMLCADLPQLQ